MPGELIIAFREGFMPPDSELTRAPGRVGIPTVDEIFEACDARELVKLLPTRDSPWASEGARRLERTFLVRYHAQRDPLEVAPLLAREMCFAYVIVNRIVEKEFFALQRWVPAQSTAFDEQWYFDSPNDKLDIDMPEAWAIERGSSSVVIVINDSGTMVNGFDPQDCTDPIAWNIHGDFNHLWLDGEDSNSPNLLKSDDIDGFDDDGDGVEDNIIGANFSPSVPTAPSCQRALWHAVPNNMWLTAMNETPTSWDCFGPRTHGVKVAGIAAAREGNAFAPGDVVGAAHRCKVYWVRAGFYGATTIADETAGVNHSAVHGDVINMSWGFRKGLFTSENDPDLAPLKDAIETAADVRDCVLVAAVGNHEYVDYVPFPAQFSRVLAVGALEIFDGTLVHKSNAPSLGNDSGYSNYDENNLIVDVVAPVHDGIWSDTNTPTSEFCDPLPCPCPNQEDAGKTRYGTSFAAPQASGIAALIRSRFANMKQDSVRARIKRAAEYYDEWASDSKGPNKYGKGKINAYRSVTEWGKVATNASHAAEWGGQRAGWPDTLYISGDLFVEAGDTLILNRGTVIRVAPEPIVHNEGTGSDPNKVEIIVRGTLRMGSTGTGPVIFESFTPGTPTASDWAGIRFESGSSGVLRNVLIKNATQDVVVDEFGITVANWDTKRQLYLNRGFSVTSDLTIPSTDSLFVLGASQVTVTGGVGVDILVDGSLICKGNSTKRPDFRSSTGASSSWSGVKLNTGSENHLFYYTIIRDAQLAIRNHVPITVERCMITEGTDGLQGHANLTVKHTRINNHIANGIGVYAGTLVASNDTIYDCAYGVSQSTLTSTGPITLSSSYLHDFDFRAVHIPFPSGGVTIKHSLIEGAFDGIVLAAQSSALIDSCTVRNNDLGIFTTGDPSASIRYSKIAGNTSTGIFVVSCSATLQTDTVSNSAAGVFYHTSGGGLVNQSRVTNHGVGIKCDVTSSPTIRNSRISGNTDGVVAQNGSNPDLGHATGATCDTGLNEGRNSVHANSGFDIVNSSTTLTVSAECDWWDGAPNASKFSGLVDYDPYRSNDPNPVGPGSIGDDRPPPDEEPVLPTQYDLTDSRPNPFNPTTTIHFSVPAPGGDVEIAVFDVSGARVRTLVNARYAAGEYTTAWSGRNYRDQPVASGVYFIRMTSGSFVATRKVVLLK